MSPTPASYTPRRSTTRPPRRRPDTWTHPSAALSTFRQLAHKVRRVVSGTDPTPLAEEALQRAERRVQLLTPYAPGAAVRASGPGKLSSNEHALGASPRVRQTIANSFARVNRYPDGSALRQRIAAEAGVDVDRVSLGNGSDELCYLIATLFAEPGCEVVLSRPCFRIDDIVSRLYGCRPRFVPLLGGCHDLPALVEATASASVLWLPVPHNPTGCSVAPTELLDAIAAIGPTCLVVVDEAYRAFADAERQTPLQDLLTHPHVVVQRTLSKAHGLAGLRLGYAIGAPRAIAALEAIRPPFNVNSIAAAAAFAALDDRDWTAYGVAVVRRERAAFERFLTAHAIQHFPSQANFVTLTVGDRHEQVKGDLAGVGIAVRDGRDLGLDGWLRITIGLPPEMALVREVLGRHFGDRSSGAEPR